MRITKRWEVRWTILRTNQEAIHTRPTREDARLLMALIKGNNDGRRGVPLVENVRMYRVTERYCEVMDEYVTYSERAR